MLELTAEPEEHTVIVRKQRLQPGTKLNLPDHAGTGHLYCTGAKGEELTSNFATRHKPAADTEYSRAGTEDTGTGLPAQLRHRN